MVICHVSVQIPDKVFFRRKGTFQYLNANDTKIFILKIYLFFIFFLEWETARSSEAAKENTQTTQSAAVDKNTVITTQTEAYTQPVTMLQVSMQKIHRTEGQTFCSIYINVNAELKYLIQICLGPVSICVYPLNILRVESVVVQQTP